MKQEEVDVQKKHLKEEDGEKLIETCQLVILRHVERHVDLSLRPHFLPLPCPHVLGYLIQRASSRGKCT